MTSPIPVLIDGMSIGMRNKKVHTCRPLPFMRSVQNANTIPKTTEIHVAAREAESELRTADKKRPERTTERTSVPAIHANIRDSDASKWPVPGWPEQAAFYGEAKLIPP